MTAPFRRTLRVAYPLEEGRIALRTEADWEKDIEPDGTDEAGQTFTFTVESEKPFLYFKPVLHLGKELFWTPGANRLVLMTEPDARPVYPHFRSKGGGRFAPPIEFDSTLLGRRHRIRVYLPPGYSENTLKQYSVLYMQDGQNLFFPDEAFLGQRLARGRDGRGTRHDERRRRLHRRGRLLEGPFRRVHQAGLRDIRPVARRRGQAAHRPGLPHAARAAQHRPDRLVARGRRVLLPRVAVAGRLRPRRLPLEHVRLPRRPARARPLRGQARGRLLPRQRLARGQLRGDRLDGHGARLARLGVRPRPHAFRLPARRARRKGLGPAPAPAASALQRHRPQSLDGPARPSAL